MGGPSAAAAGAVRSTLRHPRTPGMRRLRPLTSGGPGSRSTCGPSVVQPRSQWGGGWSRWSYYFLIHYIREKEEKLATLLDHSDHSGGAS